MTQTCVDLMAYLAQVMSIANPDAAKAYQGAAATSVWSEGGEWPAYNESYDNYVLPSGSRDMNVDFAFPGSISSIGSFLDKAFAKSTVVGLTLECGSGKSTKVVSALHNLKLGKRTYVVQPSVVTAKGLTDYVSDTGVKATHVVTHADVQNCRSLMYLSAGAMLDVIFTGGLTDNDLVVVDEAHCVTFVHTILLDVLARYKCRVLMMTASTSHTIRGLRGVKLNSVSSMNGDMVDVFASQGDKAVIVGVTENQSYAASANALIGATFAVNVIYDTGLRPEPRYHAGTLLQGERVATRLEISQMVGRVGRLGKGGTAYYNDAARALPAEGLSLYDILHRAIRNAIGLESRVAQTKARSAWRSSGLVGSHATTPGGSPVPVDVVPGDEAVESVESEQLDEDWASARGHERNKSDGSKTSGGSSRSHGSFNFHRRSSGDMIMKSYVKQDGVVIAKTQPDPNWRPFKRGSSEPETRELVGNVSSFLGWMKRASDKGDMIYPAKFPRADARVVTGISKEEARLVLAGRMLPSFSEMELMAVVILWNEMVDATRGPMRTNVLRQFLDYFDSYTAFNESSVEDT